MRLLAHWLPVLAALAIAVALAWPEQAVPLGEVAGDGEGGGPRRVAQLLTAEGVAARRAPGPVLARTAGLPEQGRVLRDATVTVLGCGNAARVGLPVRIRDARKRGRPGHVLTDEYGKVHLCGIPLDGSVRVEVLDRWVSAAASGSHAMRTLAAAPLLEVETTLRCTSNMALEIQLEDAVSGEPLAGIQHSAALDDDDKVVTGLLPGGHVQAGIAFPEGHLDGLIAWNESGWKTRVSRYASRLAMVYPLRRQAQVELYAQEHDGTPTDRALVSGFMIAGRTIWSQVRAIPHRGGFLLRDIPFLRDEALQVLVVRPPAPASKEEEVEEECIEEELDLDGDPWGYSSSFPGAAVGEGRLPHAWQQRLIITAVFPQDADKEVLFGGGGSMWYSTGCGCGAARKGPFGQVVVTVARRDGSPAVGAYVHVDGVRARTDLRGCATLERVRIGTQEIGLSEPGLVRTTRQVVVLAGQTQRVSLREAAGARVTVRVVDGTGDGLPYATLTLPRWSGWVDLHKGVQRIDPFTDRAGRRTLRHFPPGAWTFEAAYGSRKGKAEVELKHGAVQTVTIMLK